METPQQRSRQQQLLHSALPYSHYDQSNAIAFSDPWGSRIQPTSASLAPLTSTSMATATDPLSDPYRQNSVSEPLQQMSLNDLTSRDLSSHSFMTTDNSYVPTSYATSYTSQPTTTASPMSGSLNAATYNLGSFKGYAQDPNQNQYLLQSVTDRRPSQPALAQPSSDVDLQFDPSRQRNSSLLDYTQRSNPSSFSGFDAHAVDASRTMLGMAHSGQDRYSIPNSHRNSSSASSASYYPSSSVGSVSAASSISSTGSYGGYSGYGSIADNTDLNSLASNDYDSIRPSLPRPSGMIHSQALHPMAGQNAFMSTFNSRVSTNAQKKHKCKVCDKRFTRPSSLQTHMYSHTGEKPFVCGVADCGRAFSVVSNLRRHRKVHKGLSDTDTISNAGSE